jgi:hypothetical protein
MIISCTGKSPYKSKADAMIFKRERLGRQKSRGSGHKQKKRHVSRLQPYKCEACHAWHLGTVSNGKKMR